MIRAIFFDFYSVWAPDKISYYLANAQLNDPEVYKSMCDMVEDYYHGKIGLEQLTDAIRFKLGHPDITVNALHLNEASISDEITNFVRAMHAHFLKVGILANLGQQESELLNDFNQRNQLFEVIASPLTFGLEAPLLSREVFVQALGSIGEPPESCLLVSGNPYFLAYAANFGIATLQYEGLSKLENAINTLLSQNTT